MERYRKGRGPRRGRCLSYWDEDFWGGEGEGGMVVSAVLGFGKERAKRGCEGWG